MIWWTKIDETVSNAYICTFEKVGYACICSLRKLQKLTDKVGTWDMIFIASVLDFSRCKAEGKNGDSIRVLICHNQKLPTVVELEMARCLSSCMKEANLSKCTPHSLPFATAALFHTEYREGFMSSIRDDNMASRLMNTCHDRRTQRIVRRKES